MRDLSPAEGLCELRTLIVGPASAADFAGLLHEVRLSIAAGQLDHVETLAAALRGGRVGQTPVWELILVLQEWPDQYARPDVLELIDRFPLARLIVCYGPWCDSDGRTRELWPAGSRVPAAIGAARLRHELAVLRGASAPLPLTANRDDAFAFDYSCLAPNAACGQVVELLTPDPALREWLGAALAGAGHTVEMQTCESAELFLWDVDPWSAALAGQIADRSRRRPHVPIIALCGFPRAAEQQQLQAAGVTEIISKLAPLEQLLATIDAAAGQRCVLTFPPAAHPW